MRDSPNKLQYTCSQCGAEVDLDDFIIKHPLTQEMILSKRCHKCSLPSWTLDRLKLWQNMEIIDGRVVICHEAPIGMNFNAPNPRGYIYKNDGSVIGYYKAWSPMIIPEEFRKIFPDTGRFLPYNIYRKIKPTPFFRCRAIGCYDRYHCYWYHADEMEKNGAWNVVPDKHVIGDECCNMFIDKNTMFDRQNNT